MVSSKKSVILKFFGLLLLALFAFFIFRTVLAPYFFRITENFSYTAELISIDNFYDEENERFSGENRSITTFAYFIKDLENGIANIQNIFDARTIAGEKIITIDRLYAIDQKSWKHQSHTQENSRSGHLFGPHNLKKDDSFTYWHVNYDVPINMTFEAEEVVEGTLTHRFHSQFTADQTQDLTHLPDVPENRGVDVDVELTLWIEPVSGWLVKYEDNATAYYYDADTNERLHPWNTFHNTYTKASIVSQAQEAKTLRTNILFVDYIAPLLLTCVIFFVFFRKDLSVHKRLILIVVFCLLFSGVLISTYSHKPFFSSKTSSPTTISISRWVPSGNTAYDQNIQGFKDAFFQAGYVEGKDIVFTTHIANADQEQQKNITQSFQQEAVDLIYSLTTPGTLIIKELIQDIPIVFSIVTYPVETNIVESLAHSGNNLVGTRNWISVEEQLRVFREIVPQVTTIGFVHRTGEVNSTIQLSEMQEAAANFNIDVVPISGKNLSELKEVLAQTQNIDSIFSACDTLVQGEAEEDIIAFAHERKIPSFSCNSSGPQKGDLVGTTSDFYQIGNLAGEKAVLILEGLPPSSLPTDTATRPLILVNLRTAALLDITIPQSILSEANELID